MKSFFSRIQEKANRRGGSGAVGHTALNDRSHKETKMYSPRVCGVGGRVGEGEKNARKQLSDKGDTWRPPDDRWP